MLRELYKLKLGSEVLHEVTMDSQLPYMYVQKQLSDSQAICQHALCIKKMRTPLRLSQIMGGGRKRKFFFHFLPPLHFFSSRRRSEIYWYPCSDSYSSDLGLLLWQWCAGEREQSLLSVFLEYKTKVYLLCITEVYYYNKVWDNISLEYRRDSERSNNETRQPFNQFIKVLRVLV